MPFTSPSALIIQLSELIAEMVENNPADDLTIDWFIGTGLHEDMDKEFIALYLALYNRAKVLVNQSKT